MMTCLVELCVSDTGDKLYERNYTERICQDTLRQKQKHRPVVRNSSKECSVAAFNYWLYLKSFFYSKYIHVHSRLKKNVKIHPQWCINATLDKNTGRALTVYRMSSSTGHSLSGKNSPACWLITTQQFIYNIPQWVCSWESSHAGCTHLSWNTGLLCCPTYQLGLYIT